MHFRNKSSPGAWAYEQDWGFELSIFTTNSSTCMSCSVVLKIMGPFGYRSYYGTEYSGVSKWDLNF